MKRDLTYSTTSPTDRPGTTGRGTADGTGAVAAAGPARPQLMLLHTRPWSHTLILKGSLDRGCARELEDEIECLRQEGVTTLTLDLREVEEIDARAAEVIASQSDLFARRGRQFTVLAESPGMHRVLAEAGGTHLLAPEATEVIARRLTGPASGAGAPGVSTTMVKDLGLE